MTNCSVLWAVCFLPCSGNVHASDEFLLKEVEMKKKSIMQTDFKTSSRAVIFFFFASPANSIFSTCQMWHAEYVLPWIYRQLNELQWHFISFCLSASCLFLPFSFFILTVQRRGQRLKDLLDLHGGGVKMPNTLCSEFKLGLLHGGKLFHCVHDLLASSKCLFGFTFTTAMTQRFPFKLRDAALIWNFQTYSDFNVIIQRGGGGNKKNNYI